MARKVLNGLDLTNQKIVNLADPTAATDAVNKQYLEAFVKGLSWKPQVRAATTTNGTLASAYANGSSIDGVTLATGDRILLKNQTTGGENGIYTVNASGAPTRATDADTTAELVSATVFVTSGTVNADTAWVQTVDSVTTVGTTAQTWVQFGAGGGTTYSAGNGLALASTTFSVTAFTGISVSGSGVAIDTAVVVRKYAVNVPTTGTTVTITHNLGTLDVTVAVYEISGGAEVECDVVVATTNTVTLTFAVTPTAAQYRCVVHA